jgi:hypothetical protein
METTDKGIQGELQHFLTMLQQNAADLPFLDVPKASLAAQLAQAQDINRQQDILTASKQDASKQYRLVLVEGQRLANAMRAMVKSHYGIRSEKLVEFGLKPFRGRNRKAKTPTPAPETPTTPATPAGTKP